MSAPINDGGPAFPVSLAFNPHDGSPQNTGMYWDGNGMSLRDYIATHALQGILANQDLIMKIAKAHTDNNPSISDALALEFYGFADSMLKARTQQQQ